MAETPSTDTASATTAPSARTVYARAMLPYLLVALLASGAMAWYFFVFVPSQLEYFIGARFRTLAIASGQVTAKADNLKKSLDGAIGSGASGDNLESYLRILVPEMQVQRKNSTSPPSVLSIPGPSISETDPKLIATVPWEKIMVQASAASVRDFDDLILADAEGQVLWQRGKSTARAGNLQELLNTPGTPGGLLSGLSWGVRPTDFPAKDMLPMPGRPMLKPVNLSGHLSYLLVQRIDLPYSEKPETFYVAGLVSSSAVQGQARHIPTVWIVLFALPLVLLFLALPFVKLATLTSKERYSFADVVLLGLATIFAAGIGAVLPFVATSGTGEGDRRLSDFAAAIEDRLFEETKQILKLADDIQKPDVNAKLQKLDGCEFKLSKVDADNFRCDLWQAMDGYRALELDVVAWVGADGEQQRKWSTKKQVTGKTSHKNLAHFQNIQAGNTWTLKDEGGNSRGFTIDPLRSPTTSDLGFVFAVAGKSPGEAFILNVRPQSVVDPVVPPGYGFAILERTGRVLFHSEEGLSLEENFFAEVGDRNDIQQKSQTGQESTWREDYHGRPHRLFMRPLTRFTNSPWLLVTFQEIEPLLASEFRRQTGIFRMGCINLGILTAVVMFLWLRWHSRNKEFRDSVMAAFAVHSAEAKAAREASIRSLQVLTVLGIAAFFTTYLPGAQHWLNVLYLCFVFLPLLAIGAVVCAPRFPRNRKIQDKKQESIPVGSDRRLFAQLALLVLLVGGIPAAGFARIVSRFERMQETEAWLQTVQQNWTERQARVRDRVNGPGYADNTKASLLAANDGFASPWSGSSPKVSYLGILAGVREAQDMQKETQDLRNQGQQLVKAVLAFTLPRSNDTPVVPASIEKDSSNLFLPSTSTAIPAVSVPFYARFGDGASALNLIFGLLILVGIMVAVYWAVRTLSCSAAVLHPSLVEQIRAVSPQGSEGILVIGPPRINKDQIVKDLVSQETNNVNGPERISLLSARLPDEFVGQRVSAIHMLPIEGEESMLDSKGRLWIHVSNLEAQLTRVESRTQVLQLLEKLLHQRENRPPNVVVVTSSIDPITHFKEIFAKEREGIYADAIPEVELSRSALLLSRFRRCHLPMKTMKLNAQPAHKVWESWMNYRPEKWHDTAQLEVEGYEPLEGILKELESVWDIEKPVPLEELARVIKSRSRACHELLWTSCTRSEKLVLIQLAQEGFVNPKSRDLLTQLIAKGLIIERPAPAIFNYTFRSFLRGIERHQVVQEWERMEGSGSWVIAGRLVGSVLILGGLFFLVTQDLSIQSLLPIISGTGVFGMPLVRDVLARMSGRPAAPVA
jgi:hypothetical protein